MFPDLEKAQEDIILLAGPSVHPDGMEDLPISAFKPKTLKYGHHESKFFLLFYEKGVRFIIHTANLIHQGLYNMAQGIWHQVSHSCDLNLARTCNTHELYKQCNSVSNVWRGKISNSNGASCRGWGDTIIGDGNSNDVYIDHQDFPQKTSGSPRSSEFEDDLRRYLDAIDFPKEIKRTDGSVARLDLSQAIRDFDFSHARAKLVTSVPGRHQQEDKLKFGQMAVRVALGREYFRSFDDAPPTSLALQFSSFPRLKKQYFDSIVESFSAGFRYPADPRIVWPTMKETKGSTGVEALIGDKKNIDIALGLQIPFYRFTTAHTSQEAAMPQIKTFVRYHVETGRIAWMVLASNNLSEGAWGVLEADGFQLLIKSFEIGVLLLPSLELEYLSQPKACQITI